MCYIAEQREARRLQAAKGREFSDETMRRGLGDEAFMDPLMAKVIFSYSLSNSYHYIDSVAIGRERGETVMKPRATCKFLYHGIAVCMQDVNDEKLL